MAAERRKRANVLESEGRRESQVNDAQGAADAVVLEAQAEARRLELTASGEALSLKTLTEATSGDVEKAMQVMLLSRYRPILAVTMCIGGCNHLHRRLQP